MYAKVFSRSPTPFFLQNLSLRVHLCVCVGGGVHFYVGLQKVLPQIWHDTFYASQGKFDAMEGHLKHRSEVFCFVFSHDNGCFELHNYGNVQRPKRITAKVLLFIVMHNVNLA